MTKTIEALRSVVGKGRSRKGSMGELLTDDVYTYNSPTLDAVEVNELIAKERERILREAEARRLDGGIRLTDLQLAALVLFISSGGRSHAYGVHRQLIRDGGSRWTEQAVRQAVDRLRTLGIVTESPISELKRDRAIELEIVDMKFALQVVGDEQKRREEFLARIGSSLEDFHSVP